MGFYDSDVSLPIEHAFHFQRFLRARLYEVPQLIAQHLDLPKLPTHAHTVAMAFFCFNIVEIILAPLLLTRIVGDKYSNSTKRQRHQWNVRVVSELHALVVIPLAWRLLNDPALDQDRVFGWTDASGTLFGIAFGYFLWDSVECIVNFSGIGFLVHGVACALIYGLTFRPFLAYYASRFLLWEISTVFLNLHWFMDKMGGTGSTLQFINGIMLLSTFASARLVYGGIMSYDFFKTIIREHSAIPNSFLFIYGAGNLALNGLNWFWFGKMIQGLRKRFNAAQPSRKHD